VTGRPPRLASTDRGVGPVALLVHGQPGQGADWADVAAGLVSSNRVLVPDRVGYGRTGGTAVGMAANADALARLLDDKSLDSATVVGHSFGGGVALSMALRHRDRVDALVLVSSVGTRRSLGPYDRILGLPVLGEGLAFGGWELSRWLLPPLRRRSAHLPPALGSRLRAIPEQPAPAEGDRGHGAATWRSFVTEQRALLAETPSLEPRLSSVQVPTAVVAGRRDRLVPARASADLAAAIPGAELVWVAGVGHLVPQEAPDVLVEIVRRYASRR
jgi:pimeloyl-ACP methyl ester carboxylesterase